MSTHPNHVTAPTPDPALVAALADAARLQAELNAANVAVANWTRHAEKAEAENTALLAELEWQAHSLSPAMVQARNDQLAAENAALREENALLKEDRTAALAAQEVAALRKEVKLSHDELAQLRADNAALRAALESQIAWWQQVPSGVDYEADEANESPEDSVAHLAGLAIREARATLANNTK